MNREKWALDVVYSTDDRLETSFNNKKEKYFAEFASRVIPLVIKHNGEIYSESMKLINDLLPEITEEFLC